MPQSKTRTVIRPLLVAALAAVVIVTAATVAVAGAEKTFQLENQLPNGPEQDATARARIFEDTGRGGLTLEVDIKNLFCRASGLDPIVPEADQLGGAFYAIYVQTPTQPWQRVHIFNTDCWSKEYKGVYNFYTYLARTGQSESDILDSVTEVGVVLERDQGGDGVFEQFIPVMYGSG